MNNNLLITNIPHKRYQYKPQRSRKTPRKIKIYMKSISNLIKSAARGILDEFSGLQSLKEGLIPAIKDPHSNKIYSHPMGHKYILNTIIEKQNPQIHNTIWNELFKDNSGHYSPYIGFITKTGDFLTREKAEHLLNQPKHHLQQFRSN